MEAKLKTESWLKDRANSLMIGLIFDRPRTPVFVDETPANCKYFTHTNDVYVVAGLYEEWKEGNNCRGKRNVR